jgi:hypothetical protein
MSALPETCCRPDRLAKRRDHLCVGTEFQSHQDTDVVWVDPDLIFFAMINPIRMCIDIAKPHLTNFLGSIFTVLRMVGICHLEPFQPDIDTNSSACEANEGKLHETRQD